MRSISTVSASAFKFYLSEHRRMQCRFLNAPCPPFSFYIINPIAPLLGENRFSVSTVIPLLGAG